MKRLVIVVLLLMLALTGCNGKSKVEFEVSRFDMIEDVSSYTTSYEGDGIIKTDAKGIYQVVLLIEPDGGSDKDEYYYQVIVIDGKGEFSTFDYVNNDEKEGYEKPTYDFTIVAYSEFIEVD